MSGIALRITRPPTHGQTLAYRNTSNTVGSVKRSLSRIGDTEVAATGAASNDDIVRRLKNGRPVFVGLDYDDDSGGGHSIIMIPHKDTRGHVEYVEVFDPAGDTLEKSATQYKGDLRGLQYKLEREFGSPNVRQNTIPFQKSGTYNDAKNCFLHCMSRWGLQTLPLSTYRHQLDVLRRAGTPFETDYDYIASQTGPAVELTLDRFLRDPSKRIEDKEELLNFGFMEFQGVDDETRPYEPSSPTEQFLSGMAVPERPRVAGASPQQTALEIALGIPHLPLDSATSAATEYLQRPSTINLHRPPPPPSRPAPASSVAYLNQVERPPPSTGLVAPSNPHLSGLLQQINQGMFRR